MSVNDWVPQVRQAAKSAVTAYQTSGKFDSLLEALPALQQLRQCQRADHAVFVTDIETWLAKHDGFMPRLLQLDKQPPVRARAMFRLAESRNLLTSADLVAAGLRADDVVTQYWSTLLVKNLPDDEKLKFTHAVAVAKNARIRLQGLRQLAELDLPVAREHARRLLLSASPPCRLWAEKLLNLPVEELHAIRRHTLVDPSAKLGQKITALRLCGESRDSAAKSNIMPFLKHTNPRCRAEALLAWARLAPQEAEASVRSALNDGRPAIQRVVTEAILEQGWIISVHEWQNLARRHSDKSHIRRLIALAQKCSKWDHLGFLLDLHQQPANQQLSRVGVADWINKFNRNTTSVTPEHRVWIERNLAQNAALSDLRQRIEFYLG